MSLTKRPVTIHKFPGNTSSVSQTELLRHLQMSVEKGRPRFVLDCSQLRNVSPAELHLLLCCLEEAMKHQGDVRLAMLHPQAKASLNNAGVGRLFEIYETTDSAVSSYQVNPSSMIPLGFDTSEVETEYAA